MARQASAERAWSAIARFFDNCKKNKPGKKGFPRFKKEQTHGSVEYKTCGWKLSDDRRHITFSEGFEAGTFELWGTRDLHFYQLKQFKRVRWNAARNILELGLCTVGHTGSQASGDIDLCLGEATPPNKPSRGKRKPKE